MVLQDTQIESTIQIIKIIESNNCKNTNHKSDATGCYGLRPMALKDIGVKNPYKDFSELIQTQYALQYAKYILKYTEHQTENFLVYAWLNGPSAAKKRQIKYNYGKIPYRKPFSKHWYVQRYAELKSIYQPTDFLKLKTFVY